MLVAATILAGLLIAGTLVIPWSYSHERPHLAPDVDMLVASDFQIESKSIVGDWEYTAFNAYYVNNGLNKGWIKTVSGDNSWIVRVRVGTRAGWPEWTDCSEVHGDIPHCRELDVPKNPL